MEVSKIKKLFSNYLLGKTPEQENVIVDQWYDSFDQDPPVAVFKDRQEEEKIRLEIWNTISPQIKVAKSFYLSASFKWSAAAAALLVAVCTFFFLRHQPYTEIITKNGEYKNILLEDGSQLVVNAGTRVRIPRNFVKNRQVELLDGEIYVEAARDEQHRFTVENGSIKTTVLGTAFNITAYEGLLKMTVGVVSGKVKVEMPEHGATILNKDQSFVLHKDISTVTVERFDPATLGWKSGKLILNDASFEEMIYLVEKQFGIKINTTSEKVKMTRYTTELSTSMDPIKAAEVLAAIHRLKISIHENQITMY